MSRPIRFSLAAVGLLFLAAVAAVIVFVSSDPYGKLVAAYHARKQPISPADFESPAPPDSRNAASAVAAVWKNYHLSDEDESWLGKLEFTRPLPAADLVRGRSVVGAQSRTLEALHAALALPEVDWPGPVIEPLTAAPMPGGSRYTHLRHLANLLRLAAVVHHQSGDDRAALGDVADTLALARLAGHDAPLIGHLVHLGITAVATESLRLITPDLHVDDATRPLGKSLIAALLDGRDRAADIDRCWQVERATSIETLRAQAASSPGGALTFRIVNLGAIAGASDRGAAAAVLPDWPAAKAYLARTAPPPPSRLSIGANLASILAPAMDRAIEVDFRVLTDRRLAATALGVRLYQADHGGRRPSALTALIPAYLDAIPADPFASAGRPIVYLPTPQPVLYSVGTNGADDHGDGTVTDAANPNLWSAPDYVVPLTRQPGTSGNPTTNP